MKRWIVARLRKLYMFFLRLRLKNKDVSLIASNCNGACMLHDLGLRFNSPFVNLWMTADDFIKILSDLEKYMKMSLEFYDQKDVKEKYPVGKLGDIKIYFQHYKTKEEALEKWELRRKRIDYNNLFILFSDRDGCTYKDLEMFENLPYKNKVVFTNKPYKEFSSSFYIKGFENEKSIGVCNTWRNKNSIKKYYNDFDFVGWFNKGK